MNKNIFILLLSLVCFLTQHRLTGQGLTGKWQWENEEMRAEVYFSGDRYYMEAFIINTQSQLSEGFSYYMIEGDTLIFNRIPITEGREPIAYHLIESINDYNMILVDLATGEKDRYRRLNREYVELPQYRKNEFYYAGGTNVCITDQIEKNYNSCLNFGDISVNSTIEEIESILGMPYDNIEQGGRTYKVFLLQSLDDGSQPYFAAEVKKGQVVSIQITGYGSKEHLSFSSISLGDYYSFVEQKLGKPREIGFVDEETEHWAYTPFTFSLEIRNEHVYSIKLNKQ
jgi:hypothetical protein